MNQVLYVTTLLVLIFAGTAGSAIASDGRIIAPTNSTSMNTPSQRDRSVDTGKELEETSMSAKPIVLLGASYAKGLNLDTLLGRPLINKGIGGEQSFEMLARFNKDVVTLNPDMVILWGFINDIFRSDKDKLDAAVEKIKASFIEMVSLASKNGIEPVLATEVTMSQRPGFKETIQVWLGKLRGKASYQEFVNGEVMAVNQWLKTYARENDLILLDFQSLLADNGVMRKKIYAQDDGSHISEKGYQVLAEYLVDQLQSIK